MGFVLLLEVFSQFYFVLLGKLVGTRYRKRHSQQDVQTYFEFQNEVF